MIKKIFPTFYFYLNAFLIIFSAYLKVIFKKYSWQMYVKDSEKFIELVRKCGAKVYIDTEELKNVKPPVVLISNHMSSLETFIFGYIIGRYFKFSFVVKKNLFKYPIFGRIVKFLNSIGVSRKNPKEDYKKIVEESKKLFDRGISLLVFPQATRSVIIDEDKFNTIGIKLSKIFNIQLVPICVKTDFLSIGKIIKDFGKVAPTKDVYVKVFAPISPKDANKKFTHHSIINQFKLFLSSIP